MFILTEEQRKFITATLDQSSDPQDHQKVWMKRKYAPMCIHDNMFHGIKTKIQEKYPNHTIVFDVIFESDGSFVNWHCDYESIGPFQVDNPYKSIENEDFLSIHFNITDNGGSLLTVNNIMFSYFHYLLIVAFGIFSTIHLMFVHITKPLLWCLHQQHPNTCSIGNVFNNMKLHAVSRGKRRTSYVIRLVRNNSVVITPSSIDDSHKRSKSCRLFTNLKPIVTKPMYASEIDWLLLVPSS